MVGMPRASTVAQGGQRGPAVRTAADAEDPVYDQVVRHSRIMIIEIDQPTTCREQRRKAGRMWGAQAADAVTRTPRRASRTPANSASPPLLPAQP